MDLQFSLKDIEQLIDYIRTCINEYNRSVEELDKIINELSSSWVSKETGTYESFYSQYKNNYSKLLSMKQLMTVLCNKLEQKKHDLENSAKEISASFE